MIRNVGVAVVVAAGWSTAVWAEDPPCKKYHAPKELAKSDAATVNSKNAQFVKNYNGKHPKSALGLTGLVSIAKIQVHGETYEPNTLFLFPGWNSATDKMPSDLGMAELPGKTPTEHKVLDLGVGKPLHAQFSDALGQPSDKKEFIGLSASFAKDWSAKPGFKSGTFNKPFFAEVEIPNSATCDGTTWRAAISQGVEAIWPK